MVGRQYHHGDVISGQVDLHVTLVQNIKDELIIEGRKIELD